MYLLSKSLHLLFVIAWMAAVFYLPRILVNLAEASAEPPAVRERLLLMGRRLYRFGHNIFGIGLVFGILLWLGPRWFEGLPPVVAAGTGWMHAKLLIVLLLLAHFIVSGRWLKQHAAGRALPSSTKLRWFNEIPVVLLLVLIYLVLGKPF